jgi:type 1 fimbria pilin
VLCGRSIGATRCRAHAIGDSIESGDGTSTCKPYTGNFPTDVLTTRRNIVCTIPKTSVSSFVFALKLSAVFMKTAAAPTGTLAKIPSVYDESYYDSDKNLTIQANLVSGTATGTCAIAGCTVTTPAIAVDMPKTYTYRLPKVGSTDGETALNIGLNCDAGVKVYTTISDVSNPANNTTTLSLSPDSTAKGLGYQIMYKGTPVTFGLDSAAAGNAGQFLASPDVTTGSAVIIPLTARYIRIGPIGTGSANAKATFTMSYQ